MLRCFNIPRRECRREEPSESREESEEGSNVAAEEEEEGICLGGERFEIVGLKRSLVVEEEGMKGRSRVEEEETVDLGLSEREIGAPRPSPRVAFVAEVDTKSRSTIWSG